MSLATPTPPLLLTKRLTSFLHSNLSPQIHTALLTTLSGKLLAHASSQPVSTLRTQSTVAASIWSIYAAPATSEDVSQSLPSSGTPSAAGASQESLPRPNAVTVQLTGAVLVVRKLKCGLLFVCMGPSSEGPEQATHGPGQSQSQSVLTSSRSSGEAQRTPPSAGSPSESIASVAPTLASVATTASTTSAGVAVMKRQTEELARWLDNKLGPLGVPEEGIGMEAR
jgi:hypothetical protein